MFWTIPQGEWAGEAAFIIGGGPSIKDFDFSRLRGRGRVVAVNNAGIEPECAPWADVLYWSDQRWFDWNHKRINDHTGPYKITRKESPRQRTDADIKVLRFFPSKLSHRSDALGGWCSGSSAINLAYLFGARVIILLGFDMRPGNWHDKHQKPPLDGQHRNKFVPVLESMAPELLRAGVTVLNTNPASALRCFPFADIEEILTMDDVALIEREKYLAVWEREEYRRVSPGLMETERAWIVCEMQAGQTITDFGSGPCRATKWFQDRGLNVLAIDFAPNAKETDVPFIEANLWELPDDVPVHDFGFCCDVMEHIPVEKVPMTLRNIAEKARCGVYFRIATRPDRMGPRLIQKPLHMTVRPGSWWRRTVEDHFRTVDVIHNDGRDIVLLARINQSA